MSTRTLLQSLTAVAVVATSVATGPWATAPAHAAPTPDCFGRTATIVGTSGADTLRGTAGPDVIAGLGGHDTLVGLGGNDRICGGPGRDRIDGGGGRDYLDGEAGDDRITTGRGTTDQAFGGIGDDDIEVKGYTSVARGEAGDDTIRAYANKSVLIGDEGDDRLLGGPYADELHGGEGDDYLVGEKGVDRIFGEEGDDRMSTGPGAGDLADGGDGRDLVLVHAERGVGVGGPGDDEVRGFAAQVTLRGSAGRDKLDTGTGWFVRAEGGDGDDTLRLRGRYAAGLGDAGDDTITAAAEGASLNGNAGNDTLTGGPHADAADGGDGDDRITGGAGDDTLLGGSGTDRCAGGPGTDFCDGGTPGPQENTPDDPDVCTRDTEERVSCRDQGLPERFTLTVTTQGHFTNGPTHTADSTWSASITLRRSEVLGSRTIYRDESTTGSWSVEGVSGSCTASASGALADETFAYFAVDQAHGTYELTVSPRDDQPVTYQCPSASYDTTEPIHGGGDVDGRTIDLDELTVDDFDETPPRPDLTGRWSWSIVPVET